MKRALFWVLLLSVVNASPLLSQHAEHSAVTLSPQADSVPLYGNLGTLSRPITTSVPLAQRYFDQGLRLTYGFAHGDAVRSFREAARLDPACAMCASGEAWALGPHINDPRRDSTSLAQAYDAVQRARRLRSGASDVERALIDALARRYARVPTQRNRSRLERQEAAPVQQSCWGWDGPPSGAR
jgi:hypothetical protein